MFTYLRNLIYDLANRKADATPSSIISALGYTPADAATVGRRQRVRAATTANITISTALNNADTLDGVTLATGDLVLVKDQSAPAQNGIYVVGVTPARFSEFDTYDEYPGSLIAVEEGTANHDKLFLDQRRHTMALHVECGRYAREYSYRLCRLRNC